MSEKLSNLTQYINENFGANSSYVESLYERYQSDPSLVDDSWRNFFNELTGG
ncbi:MAG: 2-oxoglutarate dehydrogenase E1 subunit family protein, partial [Pyrinomonadaceae bacterium]